ncbi:TniQ family protein [Laribacter hongkongensis]|uniref:DNA binding domain, excisionase family n=1 Tax=Laribacter hongkongensis TaxID=168471 RepID=A0A248LPD8_9NEIS|nr:TniQ family protein [Laribacter hongkongensis]ASJ26311.1 DNA binding domain, excisionase family [Laribacter hongkongensis]MCG9042111.1 TniQ family protein [Laribacter hongkongensis]MCG9068545.1 TniQ family protein [Laribacter hongkongensis]MCG9088039.1 TniQ family protein [Laribacter hongkongensis]MCG9110601.1 TniQ family protein [Laribacter hongkongensis]
MHDCTTLRPPAPTLLLRPHPSRTEGPTGYLFRLAEANFMNLRDLEEMGIAFNPETLLQQQLLPHPQLYPELHDQIRYVARLQQEQPGIWNRQHARFCPYCLSQNPHWQIGWEILHIDTCHKHGMWLIDQCTSCGEHLTWQRDSLLRCNCGADLRQEIPEEAPLASVLLSEALEQILARQTIGFQHGYPFQGMTIAQAQSLIRYLGVYLEPAGCQKPLKIANSGVMAVSWAISSLAAEMLIFWPEKFHQALDALQNTGSEARISLKAVFKEAYQYLYKGGLRGGVYSPVREAFEQWVSHNWKGALAKRNRRLTDTVLENAQWIPGKAAADRLGISMARLRYLIRSGQLDGQETISTKGRRFLMVRKDQLAKMEEELAGEITMTKAMEILGLGKIRMRRILKLLFPSARRVNDQQHLPWCISSTEVYQLAEIGEELPRVYCIDDDEISLADVLHYWQWNADEIVSLVEEVKARALVLTKMLIGKAGISRWVFKRKDLIQWRAAMQTDRINWITIPELAKVLGVKQQVAYWLTQNDYIRSHKLGTSKLHGSRVRKVDVDRFLRLHIFGTEIADRIGHSPRKAMLMLKAVSISPLRGTSIEACRQLVYPRSEALDRFIARHSVGDLTKWHDTVKRRQKAWERIIYENGTPEPDPSHFRLEPR